MLHHSIGVYFIQLQFNLCRLNCDLLFQALAYFEKLLHDFKILCSFSFDPMLENILQFVVQFQKSKPDLVARAYLQVA
jgi:hypothetical protein